MASLKESKQQREGDHQERNETNHTLLCTLKNKFFSIINLCNMK